MTSSFAERLERLKGFGLTDYQARVYLALLTLGTAEASQVPAVSKVPRTRIYSTMNQLHEKGLVEVVPEKPMKYRPVPFRAFLDRCVGELRSRAEQLDTEAQEYETLFAPPKEQSTDRRGRFEVLYGRRNVRDRIGRMYEGARTSVIAVGTASSPDRIVKSRRFILEDLAERKVSVRYAFPFENTDRELVRRISAFSTVRLFDQGLPVSIIVVDDSEAILNHPMPNDEQGARGEDVGLWTNDEAMVKALGTIAANLYASGSDPERNTNLTPMLNSIRRFVDGVEIDPEPILRMVGAHIGTHIGAKLQGNELHEVLTELAAYFHEHELGTVTVIKDQPVTVTIEGFFDCEKVLPHLGESLCRFVETVVESALRERLGDRTPVVRESRCFGTGANNCRIKMEGAPQQPLPLLQVQGT